MSTVHRIIGTAGHIDHGKTSLIKALTGQDTDRLKEEKERGISIDLGFAHLDLPDGVRAGIVDVPGHERFIRNMLAGAHGMDLVLFTVAADDGVMPQTEEHLDIVHLLGVNRAIFVITKIDRVGKDRIDHVAREVRALAAGSSLADSPTIPVSIVTGEGLVHLRDQIAETINREKAQTFSGRFRLPVDRAFLSSGHGLIVTGTAIGGEVRPGDSVRCLPAGDELRVRSVEVHGASVDVGHRGQRTALNLAGSSRGAIGRGDVLCDPAVTLVTTRFDARLEIRPRSPSGVKDYQKIRLHVGTAERLGKVIVLGSAAKPWPDLFSPGESAYCQIVLDEPVHVLRGDRFIVRDETAQRTLGGGTVVHPLASKHKRGDQPLMLALQAFERGDEVAFVRASVQEARQFAVPLAEVAQLSNLREDAVHERLRLSGDVHVFATGGDVQFALEESCRQVKASLAEVVRDWHAARPLTPGIALEDARTAVGRGVPQKIFRMIVDELVAAGTLVRDGNVLALSDHRLEIPERDRAVIERIQAVLAKMPLAPPDIGQLGAEVGLDRAKLMEILGAMERRHTIVGVASDLYFLREAVDSVKDDLAKWLSTKQSVTAAEFRDRYKTSRKYAIPLLEYFDREGITLRRGDVRLLRRPMQTETA